MKNVHLEVREGDGRMILKCVSGEKVVTIGGGRN
jgi:hypothetical protein